LHFRAFPDRGDRGDYRASSSNTAAHVPFAWAISSNNKTIIGANNHGNFQMTVMSPDRIETCYSHTGLGQDGSIVATCYTMGRMKQ
jgi:hypothetical protein